MNPLIELLLLAIAAAFYPTLLAVVLIFLGRPHPKRLLMFFLAGALLASISIGLAAVFALDEANLSTSSRATLNAGVYIGFGALALVIGAHFYREPAKKEPKLKKKKGPSLTDRVGSHESAWFVFVAGMVLNLPGMWYLIALKDIALASYSDAAKVVLVVGFNLIMFALIEVPLLGYVLAPEWTQERVRNFNSWLHSHARRVGAYIAFGLGIFLIVRGILAAI
jgi:Sap, sulfolipid-1-addressing protein